MFALLLLMLAASQFDPGEPCDGQSDLCSHMRRDSIGAPRRLPAR